MSFAHEQLGTLIRSLRRERDIGQKEVVAALPIQYSIRSFGRVESGQRRPSRKTLVAILTSGLKLTEVGQINRVLEAAEYAALSPEEIRRYQLIASSATRKTHLMSTPEPQKTIWGPNDGKPPGISVEGSSSNTFIPWEELKLEVEQRLLNQLGLHIPPNCTVALGSFRGRPSWLTPIVDREGNRLGEVWFGTDPDNDWARDGLVRAGDDTYVVWQVFQRYSDGTYRRIRAQKPRALHQVVKPDQPGKRTG